MSLMAQSHSTWWSHIRRLWTTTWIHLVRIQTTCFLGDESEHAIMDGLYSNIPDSVLWTLWNPTTSKLIRLPVMDIQRTVSHEPCLSAPPSDQGSVFLLFTEKIHLVVVCRLNCNRWQRKWIELSYEQNMRDVEFFGYSERCFNSKVYALVLHPLNRHLIQVDIVVRGNELIISLMPIVRATYSPDAYWIFPTFFNFLKGSSTDLFYIEVCYKDRNWARIEEVHLFKLDSNIMMWEDTRRVKDSGFFLDFTVDHTGYVVFYKPSISSRLIKAGCAHIMFDIISVIYHYRFVDRTMTWSYFSERERQVMVWALLESRY